MLSRILHSLTKTRMRATPVLYSRYISNQHQELIKQLKIKNKLSSTLVSKWIPDKVFQEKFEHQFGQNFQIPSDRNSLDLFVIGQGTVELREDSVKPSPFTISMYNKENGEDEGNVTLKVDEQTASITFNDKNGSNELILDTTTDTDKVLQTNDHGGQCRYWLSIFDNDGSDHDNGKNGFIKYGIGELREKLIKLEYKYTEQSDKSLYDFIDNVNYTKLTVYGNDYAWRIHRDSIVSEPPLLVVDNHKITMDDVDNESRTVIQNLPSSCSQLYHNIYGEKFVLDTDDFREFSQAIEESIAHSDGWCYQKLQEKADGKPAGSDRNENYLRITLGKNHCNSPGIPYVMEIWPCHHYSSIHNHGDAHAIIRVLYGEIQVSLYPFLSPFCDKPFDKKTFKEGDITYMTSGINQIHKLRNVSAEKTCITIQCYQYDDDNKKHYEYFDYVDGETIEAFDPVSDMGYGDFKKRMREEYFTRNNIKQ